MTERVYLHVGAPKSGTTYLQSVLRHNAERLAGAGVLVAGTSHLALVHAGMAVRQDKRLEKLPPRAAGAWDRIVAQVREWSGPSAVVSYELFAGATQKQAAKALADLAGLEVHVVVGARDFGKALPSAWQERLKFAYTTPLEEFLPKGEEGGPRAEWSWRTMDPAGVTQRWGADLPPHQVHVVTVPKSTAAPDELWRRFAEACAIDVPGLDLSVTRSNESLGPVSAELLRRVNERVDGVVRGNREQARWLRDTLAHDVLVPLGGGALGITDEQYADTVARSDAAIAALRDRGYAIHGDLDDLAATRPDGRTPGESTDAELLDAAVEAIVGLLGAMKAQREELRRDARPVAPEPVPSGVAARARRAVKRAVKGTGQRVVDNRLDVMTGRVQELEAQVMRDRRLHQRVAELDDVVSELLLPSADLDDEALLEAIREYRKGSV